MKKLIVTIKKSTFEIAKEHRLLRVFLRKALFLKRLAVYKLRTLGIKSDEKTVVFCSFDGREYSCSPKAIYLYMAGNERFCDYKFIWSFNEPEKYGFLLKNPNTTIVCRKGIEFEKSLAKAGFWIFNYRAPDHIFPKKSQTFFQCWHGTPLKRLGYDLKNTKNATNSQKEIYSKYKTDAKKFRYLLSPSAFASEKFISAWNLRIAGKENCIFETGYPRNDYLITYSHEDVQQIKTKLGLIGCDKKIILYAPTWRDNEHDSATGFTYNTKVDFDKLRDELSDKFIILFRAHYLVSNSFDFEKYNGFVYDVSHYDDINELYVVSDMLITDYSSVFFDYANLKRPIIFYMYDYEFYKEELRGFYIDMRELPGEIVHTDDDLIKEIYKATEHFEYREKYKAFNDKYNCLDDGKAAKRVVEMLFISRRLS